MVLRWSLSRLARSVLEDSSAASAVHGGTKARRALAQPRIRAIGRRCAVRGVGAGREMFRHFAHLAERLEGVAKEADLPVDTVLAIHLSVRAGGAQAGVLSRRSTLRARSTASSGDAKHWCLERSLPQASATESGWIVRDSRPAVGLRSGRCGSKNFSPSKNADKIRFFASFPRSGRRKRPRKKLQTFQFHEKRRIHGKCMK